MRSDENEEGPPEASLGCPWDEWLAAPALRVVPGDATIGGTIRACDEDFEVEEIPAYEPSGEGDHLFLWVEKRGKNTQDVIRALSRELRISDQEIGTAGMKDRHAVTRQWISVPLRAVPAGHEFVLSEGMRVLEARAHGNKLRTGHLRGNRFRIVVRDPGPDALPRARAAVSLLEREGIANLYGGQRFGREGNTVALGLSLLGVRGAESAPRGRPSVRGGLARLALSAVQSVLFNRVLHERVADGLLHTVVPGDLMQVAPAGGFFTVEDVGREQARLEAGEILLTGPMFGRKMRTPLDAAAEREARVLRAAGLTLESFAGQGKLLDGARRPLLLRPAGLAVAPHPHGVVFAFELPAGAYATVVLRELLGDYAEGAGEPSRSGRAGGSGGSAGLGEGGGGEGEAPTPAPPLD